MQKQIRTIQVAALVASIAIAVISRTCSEILKEDEE